MGRGRGGGVKNPIQGTGVMVENPTNRTDFGRKLEKKSDFSSNSEQKFIKDWTKIVKCKCKCNWKMKNIYI